MAEKKIKIPDDVQQKYGDEIDNLIIDGSKKGMTDGDILLTRPVQLPIPNTSYKAIYPLNRIIFGAPGTGKSNKLDEERNELLKKTAGTYERVTFYPEYTYSQFMGCYKPISDGAHHIDYEFVPGPFLRVLVAALKSGRTSKPQPHLLLIEEINRAKPATVFGDVFQLLDRDKNGVSKYHIHTSEDVKRYLAKTEVLGGVPENYEELVIPNNMYIWATMNSADQGVQPMDTAFKRRWNFEYLSVDENEFSLTNLHLGNKSTAPVDWNKVRTAINDMLSIEFGVNEDKLIGPYFISGRSIEKIGNTDDAAYEDDFNIQFRNKVLMYLFEDAGKRYRDELFKGCKDTSKFSAILKEYDIQGIGIFGDATSAFGKYYVP